MAKPSCPERARNELIQPLPSECARTFCSARGPKSTELRRALPEMDSPSLWFTARHLQIIDDGFYHTYYVLRYGIIRSWLFACVVSLTTERHARRIARYRLHLEDN